MKGKPRLFWKIVALPFSLAWSLVALLAVLGRIFGAELVRRLFPPGLSTLSKQLLSAASPFERERAARSLRRSKDPRATAVLVEGLASRDREVVGHAIQALAQRGDRAAIPALLSLHATGDTTRCAWVARAFTALPDPSAVAPLLGLLERGDWTVAQEAIPALGACKDGRATGALARIALDHDSAEHLRTLAIAALGEIGDPGAIEPLTTLLDDPELGEMAGESLASIPHASRVVLDRFVTGDPRRQAAAMNALAYTADQEALEPLLEAAREPRAATRKRAAAALGRIDHDDARQALSELLTDRSSQVRAAAVLALAGDAQSVERIVGTLGDREPSVRRAAVEALRKHQSQAHILGLATALRDGDPGVRSAAVAGLTFYGNWVAWRDERVLGELARTPADPDAQVRHTLAGGLDRFPGVEAARELLRVLLRDEAAEVRAQAAMAWGSVATSSGEELHPLLRDPDPRVRSSAAYAAGRLRIESALPLLEGLLDDPDPYVREGAARAIRELWAGESSVFPCARSAVPRLLRMVDDGDWNARLAAVEALAAAHDPSLLLRFRELALPTEQDGRVRSVAEAAIRRLERR